MARVQLGQLDRFCAQEGSDAINSAVGGIRDEVRHLLWEVIMDGGTFAAEQDVAMGDDVYAVDQVHQHPTMESDRDVEIEIFICFAFVCDFI